MENRGARLHGRGLAAPTRVEGPRPDENGELELAGKGAEIVVVVVCVSGRSGRAFGELQ